MLLQEALRKEETASSSLESPAVPCVQMHHFEAALLRVQPSVSPRDQLMYESLRQKLRRCALCKDSHMSAAYHLWCTVVLQGLPWTRLQPQNSALV